MTTAEYREYLQYDPLQNIRCDLGNNAEFEDIADRLGGFKKPYDVPIAEDSSAERILSGF